MRLAVTSKYNCCSPTQKKLLQPRTQRAHMKKEQALITFKLRAERFQIR